MKFNLAKELNLQSTDNQVVIIGKPVITNFMTSGLNGTLEEPYYACQLKTPITVRCSTDPEIEAQTVDQVFIRESALKLDLWELAEGATKPEEGALIPGWTADFSKGQEMVLYQETSIKKYFQNNRSSKVEQKRTSINTRIKERKAAEAGNK